jgi:hypothetical protein
MEADQILAGQLAPYFAVVMLVLLLVVAAVCIRNWLVGRRHR